jgi:hypothetical protein
MLRAEQAEMANVPISRCFGPSIAEIVNVRIAHFRSPPGTEPGRVGRGHISGYTPRPENSRLEASP